jgi:hypothetical protein
MKIPEFKRSGIVIIEEFCGTLSGFPNQGFWSLDDVELVDWTTTNKFSRFWYYEDIHHLSILKLEIERAIQKSTNANLSSTLFQDDSNDEQNWFIGFVSSH